MLHSLKQRQQMENWQELKSQVDNIDTDVKGLKTSFESLYSMVVEIRTAIRGNNLNPNGYGPMIDDHEKRITTLENARLEDKWAATIFKIASGAVAGGVAVKLLENILK